MKKIFASAGIVAFALFLAGCVVPVQSSRTTYTANPMSVDDVKALCKANVGDDIVISQIRSTRTVYRLTAAQIIGLKNEGISQKVIDYMINTASAQSSSEAATVEPSSSYVYPYAYPYVVPFPMIDFYPLIPPPPFPWHHGHRW